MGDNEASHLNIRKLSDGKRKLDAENLLKLFATADENDVVMSSYAATNLAKIPVLKPSNIDGSVLVSRLDYLQESMANMQSQLNMMKAVNDSKFENSKTKIE